MVFIVLVGLITLLSWGSVYQHNTHRLSHDTRLVVRIPAKVLDEITEDTVDEQFPFHEEAQGGVFEGVAHATGIVRVAVDGAQTPPGFVIHVEGKTFGDINGIKSSIAMQGEGHGTFEASQHIKFDGRQFAEGELDTTAKHETTLKKVEPLPGTPIAGAVRMMAMRAARKALPDLDRIAARIIKDHVRQRVQTIVRTALAQLQQVNRVDQTLAILRPGPDWTIQLQSTRDYLQASLVPKGSHVPDLPAPTDDGTVEGPSQIEVWLRLTRTERVAARIVQHWRMAHRLLRRYIPDEKATQIAQNLKLQRVGKWTRLSVGAPATSALRWHMQGAAVRPIDELPKPS